MARLFWYLSCCTLGLLMTDDKGAPPQHVVEFGRGGTPPAEADGRLDAPAFHRNHAPILAAPSRFLRSGHLLEGGRGPRPHATAFPGGLPGVPWWPRAHLPS